MLLALIADIHANGPALDAVLARAGALGAERLVFLGDIVGYGPDPVEVTERVAGLAQAGAIVIMGNHDEAALTGRADMNPVAAQAIAWTHDQLGHAERHFLASLPLFIEREDLLFVHSEACKPGSWAYVTGLAEAVQSLKCTGARITFCGHVHKPALYHLPASGVAGEHRPAENVASPLSGPRRWLMVCGSAGQPRDNNPAAFLATYDTETRMLTTYRVAYDVDVVAARIRAAGLPDGLAVRLLKGH